MPNAGFLESYPLYKRLAITFQADLGDVPNPAIHMRCHRCKAERSFNVANRAKLAGANAVSGTSHVIAFVYKCAACDMFRTFVVEFHFKAVEVGGGLGTAVVADWIQKVGQHPRWENELEKDLEGALGAHAPLYERGLACEAEGFGVGAVAYYRRVVEDRLWSMIRERLARLEGEQRAAFEKEVAALEKDWSGTTAADLVRDDLPDSVRPGGLNPFGRLYGELSGSLHSETDEQCMEGLRERRELLSELVRQLRRDKESRAFTERLRKLQVKE